MAASPRSKAPKKAKPARSGMRAAARDAILLETSLREVSEAFAQREQMAALMSRAADVLGKAAETGARLSARSSSTLGRDMSIGRRTGLDAAMRTVLAARAHLEKSVRLGGAANDMQRTAALQIAKSVAESVRHLDEAIAVFQTLSLGDLPWKSACQAVQVARNALTSDVRRFRSTAEVQKLSAADSVATSQEFF